MLGKSLGSNTLDVNMEYVTFFYTSKINVFGKTLKA